MKPTPQFACFLAILLASPVQADEATQLTTRHLQVDAWYCDGTGCTATPRRFIGRLRFDEERTALRAANFTPAGEDWTAILVCDVARTRLARCRIEPDSTTSASDVRRALSLTRRMRLAADPAAHGQPRKNVVVSIMYSGGECGWQCTRTPPRPAPPG